MADRSATREIHKFPEMNREENLKALGTSQVWDVVVIGGGATGLGTALDAAARGYRTALLEQGDFAQGTSSRSTKLIHGGVRYLKQGNLAMVRSGLRERGYLLKNAPNLVHALSFVIPTYTWWERPYYAIGLKVYDALAGQLGIGHSVSLPLADTLAKMPGLATDGLRGGVQFPDAQFDDTRLAIGLAQTSAKLGATLLNYARVTRFLKKDGQITGLCASELESGSEFELQARVIINATGVFADDIRRLDDPHAPTTLTPSQGAHIVLPRSFFPGQSALMVPRTDDGRVLFAIPWLGHVLVGTTDTSGVATSLEPRPLAEEIEFLLAHAGRYLARKPQPEDILSSFAGLRPLASKGNSQSTASISRDHTVTVSQDGLVTVSGGKWTTFRQMAEDTVDAAVAVSNLPPVPCRTKTIALEQPAPIGLNPSQPEVVHSTRHEMARTIEDMLARRSRALFLDAKSSVQSAPAVAHWMAAELGYRPAWEAAQVEAFSKLAKSYLPS